MPQKTKNKLAASVYTDTDWEICELNESADNVVDGERILARVRGPMAVIDGKTLNNRWYPKACWENALLECKGRLEGGGLFGTVGHGVALDENTISSGQYSHKVTKLWIDEARGKVMGEILVLNTDAGRNVNVLMREGYKLAVSTRAYGDVKPGKGPGGSDLIDESNFYLQTVDFVVNPGYSEAYPQLVESQSTEQLKERAPMEEKLLESLTNEKVQITLNLNEALKENKSLLEENARLKAVAQAVNEHFGENAVKDMPMIAEGLRKWLQLEPFNRLGRQTNLFGNVNSSLKIQEALEHLHSVSKEYASLGSIEDLKKEKALCEKYAEFGSLEHVEQGYNLLKEYKQLGKTPKDIKESLEKSDKIVKVFRDVKRQMNAKKIAKQFNVNESAVLDMLKGAKAEAVIANLKKLTESKTIAQNLQAGATAPVTIPGTKKPGSESVTAKLFESIVPVGETDRQKANSAFFASLSRTRPGVKR